MNFDNIPNRDVSSETEHNKESFDDSNSIQVVISTSEDPTNETIGMETVSTSNSHIAIQTQIQPKCDSLKYLKIEPLRFGMNPIGPTPIIPIQFQTFAKQINVAALQMQRTKFIVQQKAVWNDTKATVSSAAPSGIVLPTVNHANRSLVSYRKPVSTIDTAPTTKFLNETESIDLTRITSTIDCEKSDSLQLSADNDINNVKYPVNVRNSCESAKPLLVTNQNCGVNSDAKSSNDESAVTSTSFYLSRAYKQILRKEHSNLTTNLGSKLSECVSTLKCHIPFVFLLFYCSCSLCEY